MRLLSLLVCLGLPLAGDVRPLMAHEPIHYILDTDLASDCDDAGAIAMANALLDMGEVDILAMMVSTGGDTCAPALSAINTWYGHGSIPIGTLKNPSFWTGGSPGQPAGAFNFESYTPILAEKYPNAFRHGEKIPDAVMLYRETLAKQPDGSVVINTIGPLINLANLLHSAPDKHSPLSGVDLIARKVKLLVITGGKNPAGTSSNFSKAGASVYTRTVVGNWPTPMVFVGNTVGGDVLTGWQRNTTATEGNPARAAYRLFFAGDASKERPSWDHAGVLYAIRGKGPWFELVEGGHQVVADDGSTTWTAGAIPGRQQAYLRKIVKKEVLKKVFEDLMTQGRSTRSKE